MISSKSVIVFVEESRQGLESLRRDVIVFKLEGGKKERKKERKKKERKSYVS